jgi:NAD(P)-dependent dehydrogenase (short-subunit alcohol dehydrogenase family)
MSLDSQTWLVTGGATGFGREIAARALSTGHNVAVTARDAARVQDLVGTYGASAFGARLDVTRADQAVEAVKQTEAHFGKGIDVVVNAAGSNFVGAVEEASDSELRATMDTHFFGVVNVIKATLPGMRARGKGHFFNFSSIGGVQGFAGSSAYSAAKFAIEGMSESLAKEVAPFGIKVTVLEPGPFQTSFFVGSGSRMAAVAMDEYADTVKPLRELINNPPSWCPGDPSRAADQIVRLAMNPEAPMRLILGQRAYKVAIAALERRLSEIEAFKEVSLAADFPQYADRTWPR